MIQLVRQITLPLASASNYLLDNNVNMYDV